MAPSYKQQQKKKARYIRSETNDKSLNKGSILNVSEFLNSRSFEINELTKAQLNAKFSSSTRAFQSLPRKLRRRTASHNVKRIPKRLRKRALREMQSNTNDNEGTGVVKKKKLPIKGKQIYQLKMRKNLLTLLTAMNQEQRKIIDNNQVTKLNFKNLKIRTRIKEISKVLQNNKNLMKVNNEIGSFDNTGLNKYAAPPVGKMKYYKRQREFAWLTTHVWHAKRAHMIKQHGFQIPLAPTQKIYKLAHRNFHYKGGMVWDKSYFNALILSSEDQSQIVEVLEALTGGKTKLGKRYLQNGGIVTKFIYGSDGKLLGPVEIISLHYRTKFNALLRLHPSIYQPVFDHILAIKPESVLLQDNRYSIGSLEITGPNALKSLTTVLKPFHTKNSEAETWLKLANEANVPDGIIFTVQMKDPRLVNRKKVPKDRSVDLNDLLIEMKTNKTTLNEATIERFLTPEGREESYRDQLSLKSIGKLKTRAQGSTPINNIANFPVVVYKTNNIWKLLAPWYWILPIWQPLNHIAHLNFGGVIQERQLSFEKSQLNYPKDYHFTKVGYQENEMNGALTLDKWNRKPKSKRFNYERLKLNISEKKHFRGELGDWSKCDWRYLQLLKYAFAQLAVVNGGEKINERKPPVVTRTSNWDQLFNREISQQHDVYSFVNDIVQFEKLKKEPLDFVPIELTSVTQHQVNPPANVDSPLQVTAVKFTLIGNGTLKPNARVYSLPDPTLQAKKPTWNPHQRRQPLQGEEEEEEEGKTKIPVPHSQYLIGFVTSGNFNLLAGENTGVGLIATEFVQSVENNNKTVLVRNVGTDVVRMARFEVVNVV